MEDTFVVSGKKTGALKKIFVRILIGNVLGWVVYVLGSFADSIIGGMVLGEEALAAIEIVTPMASLIYFIGYLVSIGCSLLHAKYIGKNDFEKADRIFSTCIYFNIIIGIITSLVFLVIKEPFLDSYGLVGPIREYASSYYDPFIVIALISPIGLQIYNCIVCDGDFILPVIADIAQSLLNIAFSIILVSRMGIKGLSIGTLVSAIIYYIIPCFRFFSKANTLHLKWMFSFKDVFDSIKNGSTTILGVLAIAVVDIVMNFFITKKYGAEYSAPYSIVNFSLEIVGALALVGETMITLMNFSIGEENAKDIKDILAISKKVAIGVGISFSIAFMACTPLWPKLFGLETEEFIKYAMLTSLTIGITFLPQTFLSMSGSYYLSYGKIGLSVLSGILNSLICPLICPIVLSFVFGYNGLITGFAVSNLLSVAIFFIILLIKYKKIFYINESLSKFYSIDLLLNNESISKAVLILRDILKENNIKDAISLKAQLIIEESLVITKERNKKLTNARIVIDINEKRVKLIEKDTGIIFNVTDQDQEITSLSNFVFTSVSVKASNAVNYVATNLNGNHYELNIE